MIYVLPPALLWIVAAWRAPAAWKNPAKRALWTTFFSLAVALTLRVPAVSAAMDSALHINNLAFLLKHLGGICAAHSVLTFVHNMAQDKTGDTTPSPPHRAIPIATAALLGLLFFATPQPREAVDLLTDYAADWRIAAYGVVWTAYLGVSLLGVTDLCWRWGRRPNAGILGRGLRYTGMGSTIGVVYVAHRLVALVLRFLGLNPLSSRVSELISSVLLFTSLLFIVVGSSLPAARRLPRWWRDYRDLLHLHPLWRRLTDSVPYVRLDRPTSRAADALRLCGVNARLYRRTIEIRDAVLALNDYAPSDLRDRAYAHVAEAGLNDREADTAVDACWLAGAELSRRRNKPSSSRTPPPTSGGRDLPEEIRALKQLSAAYASDVTRSFTTLLDATPAPETSR